METYEKYHIGLQSAIPYKLSHHPTKGRILVAKNNINPGDVIFGETVMVSGPSGNISDNPVCLVCLKKVSLESAFRCEKCKYPVCSMLCSTSHLQNHADECSVLSQEHEITVQCYPAILTLRCLLMKQSRVDDWNYFQTFCGHLQELKQNAEWNASIQNIVKHIRNVWKFQIFSDEEIEKVEAIVYTNGLEHHTLEKGTWMKTEGCGRGFYPITSLCSHDCINNTFRKREICGKTGKLILQTLAKIPIKEGDEITLHYSCGLKGRHQRRNILKEGWNFDCFCDRCLSPSELSSHMSTLTCCEKCDKKSNVLPEIQPDTGEAKCYKCEKCKIVFSKSVILNKEQSLIEQIENTYQDDVEGLEKVLSENQSDFHDCHYLILILKWLLINLYGRKSGYSNKHLSQSRLDKKISFCQHYLKALDIVDPGISHNRAKTLWEMYSVQVFKLQTEFEGGKIHKDDFKLGLKDIEMWLKEIMFCLQFNYKENQFESKLYELSHQAVKSVRETVQFLQMM